MAQGALRGVGGRVARGGMAIAILLLLLLLLRVGAAAAIALLLRAKVVAVRVAALGAGAVAAAQAGGRGCCLPRRAIRGWRLRRGVGVAQGGEEGKRGCARGFDELGKAGAGQAKKQAAHLFWRNQVCKSLPQA